MEHHHPIVTKNNGETEQFSEEKLRNSLRRAGADESIMDSVVERIEKKLYNGMTTKEIYRIAKKELEKTHSSSAAKYNLREALALFGPRGFAFEKFIGKLLEKENYKIKMNQIMQGKCVDHEIDVSAYKDDKKILVECKFHEKPWSMSHIQTVLYVNSRFRDLSNEYNDVLIVTNTKFSEQAVKYATCSGMNLLGWSYPRGGSLQRKIEENKIWPVTMIPSLNRKELDFCIHNGLILLEEVTKLDFKTLKHKLKTSSSRARRLLENAKKLMEEL